jgi:hypothetical protein
VRVDEMFSCFTDAEQTISFALWQWSMVQVSVMEPRWLEYIRFTLLSSSTPDGA